MPTEREIRRGMWWAAAVAAIASAIVTASRWQLVWFVVMFAMPWVIGQAFILLQAVRFVCRVWGWLT